MNVLRSIEEAIKERDLFIVRDGIWLMNVGDRDKYWMLNDALKRLLGDRKGFRARIQRALRDIDIFVFIGEEECKAVRQIERHLRDQWKCLPTDSEGDEP